MTPLSSFDARRMDTGTGRIYTKTRRMYTTTSHDIQHVPRRTFVGGHGGDDLARVRHPAPGIADTKLEGIPEGISLSIDTSNPSYAPGTRQILSYCDIVPTTRRRHVDHVQQRFRPHIDDAIQQKSGHLVRQTTRDDTSHALHSDLYD